MFASDRASLIEKTYPLLNSNLSNESDRIKRYATLSMTLSA
jgi:hypothetical protein